VGAHEGGGEQRGRVPGEVAGQGSAWALHQLLLCVPPVLAVPHHMPEAHTRSEAVVISTMCYA
jgi:hypothetical protein